MARVLHVSASFPRHDGDHVVPFLLDLVREQQAAGWDVSVVALHDEGLPSLHDVDGVSVRRARYGPDRLEVLAYRGGLVHALPRWLSRSAVAAGPTASSGRILLLPGLMLALAWRTIREIRRTRPQVVHAHWLVPGGLVVALIPRRWRPRSVVTLHGTDVTLAEGRLRPIARWVLRRLDGCAAVSPDLAARAERAAGLAGGTVGPAPMPLGQGTRSTPMPMGERTVLAAGRASHEKGLDVLLDALALPECADIRATVVTDGPGRPALEAQVEQLSLTGRVELRRLVPRSELFELMRSHHVVVVPSRSEGLGLVALEALAMGRPVVASAVGGLVDLVGIGDGMLVPSDDPAALAAALATVPLRPPVSGRVAAHRPAAVLAAHRILYGWEEVDDPVPRNRVVKALQALFVVVVVAVFIRVASQNASELRSIDLRIRPGLLVLALPVSLAAGPVLPLAWRQVLRSTGHALSATQAVRCWYLGQTARYLPTGLVAFASRAVLVGKHGVPQRVTMATVAVELGLIVGVGGGLAAACLPSSELAVELRLLGAVGCLVGLAAGPWLLRWASGRIELLDPHRRGGWDARSLYEAEGLFLVNAVAKSLAFALFASAVVPVERADLFLLIGAFNAANTLGTVGITPAGLGVREGAMAAILADRFGLGDGAALAVAARVWDTLIEVLWLAIVQNRGFRTMPGGQEPVDRGA